MAKTYNLNAIKNTRLYQYSLVFFLLITVACQSDRASKISLVWEKGKAKGILIPEHLIANRNKFPATVSLNGSDRDVLGNFIETDSGVLFQPLIPLSHGMEYGVIQQNRVVGKISVPQSTGNTPPKVVVVYPLADTVPENLLKLYIQFSEPMRTGNALEHVFLLDKNRDTLDRVFLNLQPELWSEGDTVLTLWIDPGRIKRNLVLNKELGNPLQKNQAYELVISGDWKDRAGVKLEKSYTKKFIATDRVDERLSVNNWNIRLPKAGTKQPLLIKLNRPLDHYLLQESVTVLNSAGEQIKGTVALKIKDSAWEFMPAQSWAAGKYKLRVAARLEDLAGNNLNKIFDRDIYKQKKADNAFYERDFEIR